MSIDEKNDKEMKVAFYSATLNAWYGTTLERDKHLLALASAGIGLLVTLATTVGIKTCSILVLYFLAVGSFLICIIVILHIFQRNADYLGKVIEIESVSATDPILKGKVIKSPSATDPDLEILGKNLKILDKIAEVTFILGISFMLAIGLCSGIEKFNRKETSMRIPSTSNIQFPDPPDSQESSLEGAPALKPNNPSPKPIQEKADEKEPNDSSSGKN